MYGRWPVASPPCLAKRCLPPLRLITRIVDRLRLDRARALLGQALTIEAQGGLTLPDGHRRTPGGTFFYLLRTSDAVSREEHAYIFPSPSGHPRRTGAGAPPAPPPPPPPTPWTADTYRAIMAALHRLRRPQAVGESCRGPGRRPRGRGHHRRLRRPRPAGGGHRRLRHERHHQASASDQTRCPGDDTVRATGAEISPRFRRGVVLRRKACATRGRTV